MSKLVCMGECLIDFVGEKTPLSFVGKAGGAPANVCACVGKLGGKACYLGSMAKDNFGKFLLDTLQKNNVSTKYVKFTDKAGTGLAFVSLDNNGERTFDFYRNPCADMLLSPDDVPQNIFDKGDVLHFCSVDLVDCPTKEAHKKAIMLAQKNGAYVSFDVNLRLNIWNDDKKCIDTVKEFLTYSDIVKLTDEELFLVTQTKNIQLGIKKLYVIAPNINLIFITMGKDGVMAFDKNSCIKKDAIKTNVVDTTGAGDCFCGCIIYNLLNRKDKEKVNLKLCQMNDALDMATKACSIVIGKKGALESMPTLDELK